MEKIEQQLKNIGSKLGPSAAAEDRVFEKVMARLSDSEHSKSKENIMTGFISKFSKPALLGGMMSFLVVLFFAPALLGTGLNNANLQPAVPEAIDGSLQLYGNNVNDDFAARSGLEKESYLIDLEAPEQIQEDTTTPENERAKQLYASLTLAATDVRGTYTYLTGLTAEYGGYIESSSLSGSGSLNGYIKLRVPAENFYALLDTVRSRDVEITAEQLTVSDRQNQLSSLQETTGQLQEEIADLKEKLKSAQDADKALLEKELAQLEARLAAQNEQISELSSETDLATIELRVSQKDDHSLIGGLRQSFETAVLFWTAVLGWLMIPLFCAVPLLVIAAVVYKRTRRKSRRN